MAEGEGSAWMVDMVIQFMHSPSWNEPINSFISEKCIGFDNFQEENRHEYVEVHNEFRGLIDNLLTAHLLQVDISPEQFEQELLQSGLSEDPRMQRIVSQLSAAEDFLSFKTMMLEHHIKMQQKAEGTWNGAAEEESAANDAAIAAAIAADAAAAEEAAAALAQADLEAAEAARAAKVAAAQEAAEAMSAAPSAPSAPPKPPSPSAAAGPAPSAEQERAFASAGGVYGRGAMPQAKKPAGNEKAAAIRKALLQGLKPS
eukprot:TRINITY_DN4074_c1_g5_i1.p1 TRINITY_DN4074_c1_g5~~TRINITY_DN4074_c1_g5_i1.p1  ORF type:complete len:258 (-),score=102.45 TRINITY_DN4074_c1_g5_i1:106-879(-)